MRLFIIALTILSMCFYGCKNTQKSSHEHETAEEHAAHNHDHEHENHDHEHEGHNHEEEEHENGEGHSDEIIFTKAQAAKTDFEVKEIQPGTFHQIIKTTGQVLPAPGDESIIVATNNGVISYANNNQAENKDNLFFTLLRSTWAKEIIIPVSMPITKKPKPNTNELKN